MAVARRPRRDPATGEEREMTDEEYLVSLLENLDKLFDMEVEIDPKTGKGRARIVRRTEGRPEERPGGRPEGIPPG